MSRVVEARRRRRVRTPVLVVVILLLRTVIYASVIGVAVLLYRQGEDLSAISRSLPILVTAAAAVAITLTRARSVAEDGADGCADAGA